MILDHLTPEKISLKLASLPKKGIHNQFLKKMFKDPVRHAAVLIPLLRKNDAWYILLIRRTEMQNDIHSGQVAFPGGRCDPSDSSAEAAALRETHEEFGISPSDVQILGKLSDFLTISNYQVTPVVGIIPWPYSLQPSHEEVSRVFTIPLSWLNDPINMEISKREIPGLGNMSVIYFKEYDNEVLWGVSAMFTIELLNSLRE